MWRSRNTRDGTTVVCIACGTSLPRSDAREYDKLGNRWERHGKSFEHLCKECYRELCHQPRDGLESLLVDVERTIDADGGETRTGRVRDGDDPTRDADDPATGRDGGPTDDCDPDPAADRESGADLPAEPDSVGVDAERGVDDADRTFLAAYFQAVEDRSGPPEEPGHES